VLPNMWQRSFFLFCQTPFSPFFFFLSFILFLLHNYTF
jgi:hypothetical protein